MSIKARSTARKVGAAFSLIEVLIALALFAICANLITSAFINALLARERNPELVYRDIAIETVRRQLLLEKTLEDAEEGGTVPLLEDKEALWTVEIFPTELIDLFECRFDVEFPDSDTPGQSLYSETLYLLRPTWSVASERATLLEDKKQALNDRRDFDSY